MHQLFCGEIESVRVWDHLIFVRELCRGTLFSCSSARMHHLCAGHLFQSLWLYSVQSLSIGLVLKARGKNVHSNV